MMTDAAGHGPAVTAPRTGQQAAQAIVRLMQRTFKAVPPADIVEAFNAGDDSLAEVQDEDRRRDGGWIKTLSGDLARRLAQGTGTRTSRPAS